MVAGYPLPRRKFAMQPPAGAGNHEHSLRAVEGKYVTGYFVAVLAGSFNRMRRSLERALKMIEGEV